MENDNVLSAQAASENGGGSVVPSGKKGKKLTRREKGRIVLIVFGAIAALIALLAVILAPIIVEGNKVIVRDSVEPDVYLTEWMSFIADETPITDMAIPGSHDSGCIEMPWYAATQDLTFAEQLDRGVRYFDIRVNKKGDDLVIFHSIVNGVGYEGILRDIEAFMTAHPSEFLLLDFSHFKNDSEEEVFRLFDEIVSAERLVNDSGKSDTEFLDSLTLEEVRGKCIVFVDPDETDYDGREYLFKRANDKEEFPEASLVSPYKKMWNGRSASRFIEKTLWSYIDIFKGVDSGFFVLQSQLTDRALIFGPRYREGELIGYAADFLKALYSDTDTLPYINIVMRDFVTCEKTALIIRLNVAKGYVEPGVAEEFSAAVDKFANITE